MKNRQGKNVRFRGKGKFYRNEVDPEKSLLAEPETEGKFRDVSYLLGDEAPQQQRKGPPSKRGGRGGKLRGGGQRAPPGRAPTPSDAPPVVEREDRPSSYSRLLSSLGGGAASLKAKKLLEQRRKEAEGRESESESESESDARPANGKAADDAPADEDASDADADADAADGESAEGEEQASDDGEAASEEDASDDDEEAGASDDADEEGESEAGSDGSSDEDAPTAKRRRLQDDAKRSDKSKRRAAAVAAGDSTEPKDDSVVSAAPAENDADIDEAALKAAAVEPEVAGDEFSRRFRQSSLTADEYQAMLKQSSPTITTSKILGQVFGTETLPAARPSIHDYQLKQRLREQWIDLVGKDGALSELQTQLLPMLEQYRDVMFANRTPYNSAQLRRLYLLHAMNHVLKARDRIMKGTAKLNAVPEDARLSIDAKDQGFTRPRVLILVPFRHAALEIVRDLIKLSPKVQQERVENKKRFFRLFSEEDDTPNPSKPAEYNEIFKGNIDDCFRLGVSFTRSSVKVFADFYSADIIIASPLGLRITIGAEGEKGHDYDFLSSIEMLVMDQADVFLMQNWDHVTYILELMNQLPKRPRDTDFSRVLDWYLNGCSKFYRQNLIFSSVMMPEINALWNRHCTNTQGKFKMRLVPEHGAISLVGPKIRQLFHRLSCKDVASLDDVRFDHFVKEILTPMRNSTQTHTLLFVPSYFDFVRLRNYFKNEEMSFVAISEYTSNADVSRCRSSFFHGRKDFLIVTERFHFFHRYKLRGVRNIVFYALPQYAHFYPELLNLLETADASCTVLFSEFEKFQLEQLVGSARSHRLVTGDKSTFLFT